MLFEGQKFADAYVYVAAASGVCYVAAVKVAQALYPPQPTTQDGVVKKVIVPLHNAILVVWSLLMNLALLKCIYERPSWSDIFCPQLPGKSEFEDRVLWILLVSKYYELVDTVVHILLGHQISFLHTFHHCIVLVTTSMWFVANSGMILIGGAFNTGVHVIMYTYYFRSSLGLKTSWKAWVTRTQIIQFVTSMIAFCITCAYNFQLTSQGAKGCLNMDIFYISSAFNAVLLVLFVQLLKVTFKMVKKKNE